MDDNLVNKFINKIKDKFVKNTKDIDSISEYAFSSEEIANINKENKQKIQELKQDLFNTNKNNTKEESNEVLLKKEIKLESTKPEQDLNTKEEIQSEPELPKTIEPLKPEEAKNSFINLSPEHQQIVMTKWNEIKLNQIDKDIITAKDLLNHNYTITYADDAARFIHYIRKEYEIVICYLIGFNNEKQKIFNKTIFSSKIDDEWRYLNSYIKILEKIRNFKK